jgi:hypothetical protein
LRRLANENIPGFDPGEARQLFCMSLFFPKKVRNGRAAAVANKQQTLEFYSSIPRAVARQRPDGSGSLRAASILIMAARSAPCMMASPSWV